MEAVQQGDALASSVELGSLHFSVPPSLPRSKAFLTVAHAALWLGLGLQEVLAGLPQRLKVVDLSADFRLRDVNTYAEW